MFKFNKKIVLKNVNKVVKGLAIGTMSLGLLGAGSVAMNNSSANTNVHASNIQAELNYMNDPKKNPAINLINKDEARQNKVLKAEYSNPKNTYVPKAAHSYVAKVHKTHAKRHVIKRNRKAVNTKRRALKRVRHNRKHARKHSKKVNYNKEIRTLKAQIKRLNKRISKLNREVKTLKARE